MHPPPMYDYPFPSSQMLKRLPHVTDANTKQSITFSKFSVSAISRLELNLEASGVTPKTGSPAHGLLIQGYPSDEARNYEKSATIIAKASQNLVVTRCTRLVHKLQEYFQSSLDST